MHLMTRGRGEGILQAIAVCLCPRQSEGSCMSAHRTRIDCSSQTQENANEAEFRRLRELSLEERGRMLQAACRAAAELAASRRAAGLPDPLPAPWPASTLEFLRRHAVG